MTGITAADGLQQLRQLAANGRLAEARQRAVALCHEHTENAEAWLLLGNLHGHLGDFTQAEQCLRRGLSLQPDNAPGHYQLAAALKAQGRLEEAIPQYQHTLQLQPDLARAHNDLGVAFQELGWLDKATDCYQEAIRRQPDYAMAHYNLANLQRDRATLEEALSGYRTARTLRPDLEDAIAGEAGILMLQGDTEGALHCIRPLVDRGTGNAFVAAQFAELSRKTGDTNEALDLVLRLLQTPGFPAAQEARLHFSAGNLYAQRGDFDQAFGHYLRANKLKFTPQAASREIQYLHTLQATFTRERLRTLPRATVSSGRPVFIVGMPRSGTSLVEQVLASHPAVFGAGELIHINQIANQLHTTLNSTQPYPHCIDRLTEAAVNELAAGYLQHLETLGPEAERVTDKMPHNFLNLGLIELLFPGARIIHCRRDPLDTCLSCFTHDLSGRHAYSYDLATLGTYYRAYRQLMQHWQQVLTIPVLQLDYEALVTDQEAVTRQLLAFCGLEWDARCLQFHAADRVAATASYDQVRQPLYHSAIGKWRAYERHLRPLAGALDDPTNSGEPAA